MTDILIPLGLGSRHNDLELRYCLRSIEKHLKGVGNIFIVGEKPEWVQNVVHIRANDSQNNWNRASNIARKVLSGCNYISDFRLDYYDQNNILASAVVLSNTFLFMNDDHFLLRDYEAGEFPYYHRGLINTNNFHGNPPQLQQAINTVNKTNFKSILDYDVHCPILYTKKNFRETFEGLAWPEYGFFIKSYYCAANSLIINPKTANIIEVDDCKFSEPLLRETIEMVLEDREWFSIGDRTLRAGGMKEVLQSLYPVKSKYEL